MFSFGIVMWELLTGEEPYADLHYGAIIGTVSLVTVTTVIYFICPNSQSSLVIVCSYKYKRRWYCEQHLAAICT